MRKEEFLEKLEYLLQDVPDKDREEALSYYRDYLEEAGTENEEAAVEEFGSPERVAAMIRADLAGNLKEGGSFTDTGFQDGFKDPNFEVMERLDLPEGKEEEAYGRNGGNGFHRAESGPYHEPYGSGRGHRVYEEPKKPWTSKPLKIILWAILLVILSPLILGGLGVGFGILAAVVLTILSILAAIFCMTAAAVILGGVLGVIGVVMMIVAQPIDGIFLLGLAAFGCGCSLIGILIMGLCLWAMVWLAPKLWGLCVKFVGLFTGRGKENR